MTNQTDVAEIRTVIARVDRAYRAKDPGAVTAEYTPDALLFDLAPPLASRLEREEIERWLATWDGPIDRVWQDLEVSVGGDLGVCTGLLQISATSKQGQRADFWIRCTLTLRRDAGRWKIAHEHGSVPFYMDGSYRAAVDLTPDSPAR
ncbi:MAG: nuclear transport factor 2 family protein [Kofleriaceae bacterium]